MFEKSIDVLKRDLLVRPSASLLLAARFLMMTVTRDLLPDWVEALANGALDRWEAVIEVAKSDILSDSAVTSPMDVRS